MTGNLEKKEKKNTNLQIKFWRGVMRDIGFMTGNLMFLAALLKFMRFV
jgi:hypothetical protein